MHFCKHQFVFFGHLFMNVNDTILLIFNILTVNFD